MRGIIAEKDSLSTANFIKPLSRAIYFMVNKEITTPLTTTNPFGIGILFNTSGYNQRNLFGVGSERKITLKQVFNSAFHWV